MKILIIEDEYQLLAAMETFLLEEQYVVEKAADYRTAVEKVAIYDYDCILLDISLPGGNGLNILKEMKAAGKSGNVIVISAHDSLEDKVTGLDLGADDYLTKPFCLPELHARIRALLRRKQRDGKQVLLLGNLSIDFTERHAFVNEKSLKLTRKEFDALTLLANNKNRLVAKETLAEYVWGDSIDLLPSFDVVYSQLKNLRKKLKDGGSDVAIENVYGFGYKLTV
ncbi:MAG: response regulator transcription factor [Prevotellaceae bacterium]|jgi:DNA-binding response OmpR family regulator|nr:response regulator transcription factor [Prevotellaceae bacterium]